VQPSAHLAASNPTKWLPFRNRVWIVQIIDEEMRGVPVQSVGRRLDRLPLSQFDVSQDQLIHIEGKERASLKQNDTQSALRQFLGRPAARSPRADDYGIIPFGHGA
jgi:hypothetical protein